MAPRAACGGPGRTASPKNGDSIDIAEIQQSDCALDGLGWFRFDEGTGPGGNYEHLTAVGNTTTAQELADQLGRSLAIQSPTIPDAVIQEATKVAFELGRNVVDHSQSQDTGFGFALSDGEQRRIQLAFADCRVGFRASLQRNFEFAARIGDDETALIIALQPGVSSSSDPHKNMGMGLTMLTTFADSLGGDLWIASGSAMFHRETIAGQRTNSIRSIPAWQGAWICLDAPVA